MDSNKVTSWHSNGSVTLTYSILVHVVRVAGGSISSRIMALNDHGLTLCVVWWNSLAMALHSSRGHYKCKFLMNLISLHVSRWLS